MKFLVKMTFAEQKAFLDGVIRGLDHRIGIDPDKELTWEFGRAEGKTTTMTCINFTWLDYYEVESEDPYFTDDTLYLDGSESMDKVVRDIEDILERIDNAEIGTKSRLEMLADAYFD
jgi:hypothetical protein